MINQKYVNCGCPNCKFKEFTYPHDLPHNTNPKTFKVVSLPGEVRIKIKYPFIEYLKDEEEITTLIFNEYHERGLEKLLIFLEISGIQHRIEDVIKKKRLEAMYLKKDQLGYFLHKMYPQENDKITEFSFEKKEKLNHLKEIFLSVLNDELKFENFDFEKGDLFA
jgi:hypothetical protein